MFKKFLKIIIINLSLLLIVFVVIEFVIFSFAIKEYKDFYSNILHVLITPKFITSYLQDYSEHTYQRLNSGKNIYLRPPVVDFFNKKNPVLIFGCSFAHGTNFLADNQTAGFKISKMSKRDVYNFAFPGCGIQHMLYFIRNVLHYKFPKNENPDYAIYFYIPNHIFRLRTSLYPTLFTNGKTLEYKINDNELVLQKPIFNFVYKIFFIKFILSINDYLKKRDFFKDSSDNFLLLNSIFLESKATLEKKYPGIKFVIVRYEIENDDNYRELPYMWDVLKNEGFIIINSSELIGRKYKYNSEDTTFDLYHPSEQAWDLLIPPLIKKLNL